MGEGVVVYLDELDTVHGGYLGGFGGGVIFSVVNGFDSVGAEGLHAGGAGHGGAGHDFCLAALEEAAEVDFCVEHVFLALLTGVPEAFRGGEAGEEAVVGGTDDAVVFVQRGGSDLAEWVFGAEGGHVCQRHDVFGDGESFHRCG